MCSNGKLSRRKSNGRGWAGGAGLFLRVTASWRMEMMSLSTKRIRLSRIGKSMREVDVDQGTVVTK